MVLNKASKGFARCWRRKDCQTSEKFLSDRSIKQIDLMNKYHVSRNTLKNTLSILQRKIAYDIMPIGKMIRCVHGNTAKTPELRTLGFFYSVWAGWLIPLGWLPAVIFYPTICKCSRRLHLPR